MAPRRVAVEENCERVVAAELQGLVHPFGHDTRGCTRFLLVIIFVIITVPLPMGTRLLEQAGRMPPLIGNDLEVEPDISHIARLGAVGRGGPPLSELAQHAVHDRPIEQWHRPAVGR